MRDAAERRNPKAKASLVLMAGLLVAAVAYGAAPSRLLWVVKDGAAVDKNHAEKVYFEVCQWIEEQLESESEPVRPKLTVHVGEACPREHIEGACMNPMLGELYLPEWDEEAPNALAQATVATALFHLVNEQEKRAGTLYAGISRPVPSASREVAAR